MIFRLGGGVGVSERGLCLGVIVWRVMSVILALQSAFFNEQADNFLLYLKLIL